MLPSPKMQFFFIFSQNLVLNNIYNDFIDNPNFSRAYL